MSNVLYPLFKGSKLLRVFNLAEGGIELFFSNVPHDEGGVSPLWAVCYAYCDQEDRLKELFAAREAGNFVEFAKTLPVTVGNRTIACGDWGCYSGNKCD